MVLVRVEVCALPPEALDEDRVKAAVVLQLARFVEWPSEANGARAFTICVAGKDSWTGLLEHVSAGQTVGGRPVRVRRLSRAEETPACHLVVVGPGVKGSVREAILRAPLLTISEEQGFAGRGGMVGLAVENGRVVFELNPRTARQQGIRFSSKLIRLARIIGREEQPW